MLALGDGGHARGDDGAAGVLGTGPADSVGRRWRRSWDAGVPLVAVLPAQMSPMWSVLMMLVASSSPSTSSVSAMAVAIPEATRSPAVRRAATPRVRACMIEGSFPVVRARCASSRSVRRLSPSSEGALVPGGPHPEVRPPLVSFGHGGGHLPAGLADRPGLGVQGARRFRPRRSRGRRRRTSPASAWCTSWVTCTPPRPLSPCHSW